MPHIPKISLDNKVLSIRIGDTTVKFPKVVGKVADMASFIFKNIQYDSYNWYKKINDEDFEQELEGKISDWKSELDSRHSKTDNVLKL